VPRRRCAYGRPSKLTRHQRLEAIARRDARESLTDIARSFAVFGHHDRPVDRDRAGPLSGLPKPNSLDEAKAAFRAAWERPLSREKADEKCST
jgi:hypothetical protein